MLVVNEISSADLEPAPLSMSVYGLVQPATVLHEKQVKSNFLIDHIVLFFL